MSSDFITKNAVALWSLSTGKLFFFFVTVLLPSRLHKEAGDETTVGRQIHIVAVCMLAVKLLYSYTV